MIMRFLFHGELIDVHAMWIYQHATAVDIPRIEQAAQTEQVELSGAFTGLPKGYRLRRAWIQREQGHGIVVKSLLVTI